MKQMCPLCFLDIDIDSDSRFVTHKYLIAANGSYLFYKKCRASNLNINEARKATAKETKA